MAVFLFLVPPTIPTHLVETRTAPFGSTVVMDCKTTLDPPVANTWYKQGGVLPTDSTQENGQLTIPDVKGDDAGTYICTSKSAVGTIDIPTTLIVTGNGSFILFTRKFDCKEDLVVILNF